MDFIYNPLKKENIQENFSQENLNYIKSLLNSPNNVNQNPAHNSRNMNTNNNGLPNYKAKWHNANARGTRKSAFSKPNSRRTVLNEGGPENNNGPAPSQGVGFNTKSTHISRNAFRLNQSRKNNTRRNPRYELNANMGNYMRVSRVPASNVQFSHGSEYNRTSLPTLYPANKRQFNLNSRSAHRPNTLFPRELINRATRGSKRVHNEYQGNIKRSEYISWAYAKALQNRDPESAIRRLEDAINSTNNNLKKRNLQTAINRIKRNFPANAEY